ncbi:MAG: nuclear transport factor 2 family protein [Candidatus Eremiobacteraeota bacterium]|nr:nuclear transport factor 2 family protein [Candidatus Eremiobacteraeota bacterium]
MKRLLVCLVLLLSTVSIGQEGTPTPEVSATPNATATPSAPESGEDPAHNELRLLRRHMEDAMNARDIDSILEGVADEVVFTTMNGDVVRGKDNIRSYFEKMMTGSEARVKDVKTKFEVDELTILYGEPGGTRFGVAYGHSDDEYTLADGTKFQVQPRWSATMVRDDESWKIVNFHYSVNMFDNPVVDKAMGKIAMIGSGALVLGLLVGFLLGRRKS